jgi:hypothetical protein
MLFPALENKLCRAARAFDAATTDNIVELCRQYLALLAEYRAELYKLAGTLGVNRRSSSCLWEDSVKVRTTGRAAIEQTTRERNRTKALLLSFISVSGYEAVETFNQQKYRGHDDWELRAGGVARFTRDMAVETMTVLEAVNIASLLRREEYIARGAASAW